MFRVIEQSLGSWVALVLSAFFFGLLHAGNPNATWAAALGLSLQAGVLLAAAYMVSRSLWLPIGRTRSGFWVTPTEPTHAKPDVKANGRGI